MLMILNGLILNFLVLLNLNQLECNQMLGGVPVNVTNYPYFVGIYDSQKKFECGGTLIGKKTVLTAAHCISYFATLSDSEFKMKKGYVTVYLTGNDYPWESVKIHENFTNAEEPEPFDIGLIFILADEKSETEKIYKEIKTASPKLKEICKMIGLGNQKRIFDPQEIHNDATIGNISHLNEAKLEVIKESECSDPLSPESDLKICAICPAGGACLASGDSGSPLICYKLEHGTSVYTSYVAGVSSGYYAKVWNISRNGDRQILIRPDAKEPSRFIKIASFYQWIHSNTNFLLGLKL